MNWNNYFKELETCYRMKFNIQLRNTLIEHFGTNLNIYTEQDMHEQSRKIIQIYKKNYSKEKYKRLYKYL